MSESAGGGPHAISREALIDADEKFKDGDLDGAEAMYEKVKWDECVDKDVLFQAWNNRGALKMKQGKLEEAIDDFEKALAEISSGKAAADCWYNLGAARRNFGQIDTALEAFEKCLQITPSQYICICSKAEALTAKGDAGSAVTIAKSAIDIDSKQSRAYLASGYANLKLGNYTKSAEMFEEAIKKGDSSAATKQLASLAWSLAADDSAKKASAADSDTTVAKNTRQIALKAYERSIDLIQDPNTTGAGTIRLNYSLTLLAAGKTDQSISVLTTLIETHPDRPEPRAALGALLLQKDKADQSLYAKAAEHLSKAIELNVKDLDSTYNLAIAKLKLKETSAAIKLLKKVQLKDPKHTMSKDALAALKSEDAKNVAPSENTTTTTSSPVPKKVFPKRKNSTPPKASPAPAPAAPTPPPSAAASTKTTADADDDDDEDTAPPGYPIYPYDKLKSPGPFPADVHIHSREMHLADDEFLKLIGVDKAAFAAQPKWKKDSKKRALSLF